ncbi:hypothetical protein N7E81_04415 [Reichenbachiella carrageenanivorans]|uniref:Lipocalin-like domain-containing protein n=1 Tax=Reichenbachiella carrageenanivorans TaxID=2979869 RepID=A0ABY6D2F2_9BACT|nr:lipocalin family protein [Reichenbachiella carrageenanivorans]UXX80341.1 hypothetical protein N7E81_04415 [Reichenbachiella carrageenanivorans]
MKKTQLTLFVAILSLALYSCGSSTEEMSNSLVGDWKVQWITYPEQNAPANDSINYTMNGLMNIKGDGKITINAYGYENCIFGTDTLIHTLNWKLENDTTLNLTNDGDKYGIPYTIKDFSENKIKLQLVQDVYLFLSK